MKVPAACSVRLTLQVPLIGDAMNTTQRIQDACREASLNATEGAYRRMTAVERRSEVMTRYADWLNDERGKVLSFPTGKTV